MNILEPVFFKRNRVFRVYKGGALFRQIFGGNEEDCFYPEEWIASCVRAKNKNPSDENEGLSFLENGDVPFWKYLEENKRETLGNGELNILVKILDSAVRLPVQAHPDKAFSRRYFGSAYGKTEAWLILGTRKNARVFIGFEDKITKEEFIAAAERSDSDKGAYDGMLHEVSVKTGDVFLIPPGTVHAIGQGCLILEIQEPTDFTVQPERWCGDYRLSEEEMYIGLDRETALKCFDLSICGDVGEKLARVLPRRTEETDFYAKEELISASNTDCFILNRYIVKRKLALGGPEIFVVTEGGGVLCGENYERKIKKGDYFFIPKISDKKYSIEGRTVLAGCRAAEESVGGTGKRSCTRREDKGG